MTEATSSRSALLLYAASETDSNMLYASRFFAPDPFLFARVGRTRVLGIQIGIHEIGKIRDSIPGGHFPENVKMGFSQSKSFVRLYVGIGKVNTLPLASPSYMTSRNARLKRSISFWNSR